MRITGKTIAIDFDDTIHDTKNTDWPNMGSPLQGSRSSIIKLKKLKNKIIIFSARAATPAITTSIEVWLKQQKIPFDLVTNVKPNADVFVDDRALRFENDWAATMKELNILYKP
jgi:hypothetical protein